MGKSFYIDFVRQVLEQTLLAEHIKNPNLFGGENQVNILSFYEQLQKDEDIDRYVEIVRDLTEQQNRTGLIMNGTLVAPENPTITNLNQCLVVPMSFTCSFRLMPLNRDVALETIHNLIAQLKGRKRDICEFDNGALFMVGTIGNNINGTPLIQSGDYIVITDTNQLDYDIKQALVGLVAEGFTHNFYANDDKVNYLYYEKGGKLLCAYYDKTAQLWKPITNNENNPEIILPPQHNSFEKYKISLSFDSIRCDEPRNLNGNIPIVISFGGSATLVNRQVMLGNDLTKVSIQKKKLVLDTEIDLSSTPKYWLEPLEMPSSSNAETLPNQLMSNNFLTNTHTSSLTIGNQYTFVLDQTIDLIKQWFVYARYGKQADGEVGGTGVVVDYAHGITPNMIYEIVEWWVSWGEYDKQDFLGKIVESIEIENQESDVLSISLSFQVQGEHN